MIFRPELFRRAQTYCDRHNLILGKPLGSGVQGSVFALSDQGERRSSALKIHEAESAYIRERNVYLRLAERSVREVRGCRIPSMLNWDDELLIIEMTIVTKPYVLDFGGAYLDYAPEFPDDVLADWNAEKAEEFGANWPEAQAILRAFAVHGVFVVDINARNIALADP